MFDRETRRLRALVLTFVLFVISAFFSYHEVRYAVFGKTTDAQLIKVKETTVSSRHGSRAALDVHYRFTDRDGTVRNEEDRMNISWQEPETTAEDGTRVVQIEYIPGSSESSRLHGREFKWIMPAIFLALLGYLAYQAIRFWRTYQEYERLAARREEW